MTLASQSRCRSSSLSRAAFLASISGVFFRLGGEDPSACAGCDELQRRGYVLDSRVPAVMTGRLAARVTTGRNMEEYA